MSLRNRARLEWPSLILAAVLIAMAAGAAAGSKGPRDLLALRGHRASLEERCAELRAENARLGTIVQNFRSNDRQIERLIRRELGYARDDELIYRFAD